MHVPLTVLVVLPLRYVHNYRGPWVVHNTGRAVKYKTDLVAFFGQAGSDRSKQFNVAEGSLSLKGGTVMKELGGIFCANFLRKQRRFTPCLAVWCRRCLVKHPCDTFYVQKTLDKEEDLETEEVLSDRFQIKRPGNHIMGIPLECDLCPQQSKSLESWKRVVLTFLL